MKPQSPSTVSDWDGIIHSERKMSVRAMNDVDVQLEPTSSMHTSLAPNRANMSDGLSSDSKTLKRRARRSSTIFKEAAMRAAGSFQHLFAHKRKDIKETFEETERDEESIEDKEQPLVKEIYETFSGRYIMDPQTSTFRRTWDAMLIVLILYNALSVPFRLAFEVETTSAYFVFDTLTDSLFIFDIILNFRTAYVKDCITIKDPKKIAYNYITTWFFIDLISAFPIDLILLAYGMNADGEMNYRINKLLRVLKTVRLVRVLRIARLSRILARMRAIFQVKYSITTIFKFILAVAFVAHWIACTWYLVAQLEAINDDDENKTLTWVSEMVMPGEIHPGGLEDADAKTKYIVCIYHAIMVMSTIGSHILPVTDLERIYSIASMLIGASVFAYGITNMCSLIFNLNRSEVEYRQKMDMVNDFMMMRGLPKNLRNKVREFFEHLHSRRRFFNEQDIIKELSRSLQTEVIMKLNEAMVMRNAFFKHMDPTFVTAIIQKLEMYSFLPDDTIIREGDIGTEMYFIYDGVVEIFITREKEKVLAQLKSGDYFGEIALMNAECTRTASVRAVTFCDIYTLAKPDIDEVLLLFPAQKAKWYSVAKARLLDQEQRSARNSPGTPMSYTSPSLNYLKDLFGNKSNSKSAPRTTSRRKGKRKDSIQLEKSPLSDISNSGNKLRTAKGQVISSPAYSGDYELAPRNILSYKNNNISPKSPYLISDSSPQEQKSFYRSPQDNNNDLCSSPTNATRITYKSHFSPKSSQKNSPHHPVLLNNLTAELEKERKLRKELEKELQSLRHKEGKADKSPSP